MLWRVILKSQKCIFEWSKEPIKRFLAIFGILVCCIDLILHIVMALNVFQDLATLPGHEGSFKSLLNAFWMMWSAKKEVFGHFLEFWSYIQRSEIKKSEIRNQKMRKSENQKIENRIIEMIENQKIRKPEVESSALEHCSVLNFSWGQASICWLVSL